MVNESFDTTTNLSGNKVNLPQAQPAPTSPFQVTKQGSIESAGRASNGSAGKPQYAQAPSPFRTGEATDTSPNSGASPSKCALIA